MQRRPSGAVRFCNNPACERCDQHLRPAETLRKDGARGVPRMPRGAGDPGAPSPPRRTPDSHRPAGPAASPLRSAETRAAPPSLDASRRTAPPDPTASARPRGPREDPPRDPAADGRLPDRRPLPPALGPPRPGVHRQGAGHDGALVHRGSRGRHRQALRPLAGRRRALDGAGRPDPGPLRGPGAAVPADPRLRHQGSHRAGTAGAAARRVHALRRQGQQGARSSRT